MRRKEDFVKWRRQLFEENQTLQAEVIVLKHRIEEIQQHVADVENLFAIQSAQLNALREPQVAIATTIGDPAAVQPVEAA